MVMFSFLGIDGLLGIDGQALKDPPQEYEGYWNQSCIHP